MRIQDKMTSNRMKTERRSVGGHHGLTMIVNWLFCIIFSVTLPTPTSGTNSKPFYTKSDLIIDSFVIKSNTIIRTSDSINAGARYLLSETEMSSNQQCLLLCWDNRNCSLAVYEEKSRGICYLFDCGPPDQMKCKFTGHDHYTSSLMKFNRDSVDGNTIDQRNQAKHEIDLVNLRTSSVSTTKPIPSNPNGVYVTSTTSGSLIPPPSSGSPTYTSTSASVNACKRHQFQCRNSSDCIAIYNVCDGIVQCSDGSDEAVDLHCPSEPVYASIESQVAGPPPNGGSNHQRSSSLMAGSQASPLSPSSSFSGSSSSSVSSSTSSSSTINFSNSPTKNDESRKNDLKENEVTNGMKNNPAFGPKKQIDATDFNYPKSPDFVTDLKETGRLPISSNKFNDYNPVRDKPYYPNYGGQYYQPSAPPPPSAPATHGDFYSGPRARGFASDSDYPNNFPRDVNYWQPETGMVGPSSNVRSNNVDHSLINSIYHQYRTTNDIGPMNVNNGGIASHPQTSPLIRSAPWSKNSYMDSYPHKPNEPSIIPEGVPRMELVDTQGSGGPLSGNNLVRDESNNRPDVPARTPQEYPTPIRKAKNSQPLSDDLKEQATKVETVTRSVPTTDASLVSSKPTLQITSDKGVAHLNSDKLINNWEMPIAVTHLSNSQSGRDTNSAVIALVLGVGITAMLIALVGCRMKYIKRRIARRGRNLAHDADYLVNGMYL